jgi:hypothetical protein
MILLLLLSFTNQAYAGGFCYRLLYQSSYPMIQVVCDLPNALKGDGITLPHNASESASFGIPLPEALVNRTVESIKVKIKFKSCALLDFALYRYRALFLMKQTPNRLSKVLLGA